MHFESNEAAPKCAGGWAFKDGLPIWQLLKCHTRTGKALEPSQLISKLRFWLHFCIFTSQITISKQWIRGRGQRGKKPCEQLLRAKNPLDLWYFCFAVPSSYPNDTEVLLLASCATPGLWDGIQVQVSEGFPDAWQAQQQPHETWKLSSLCSENRIKMLIKFFFYTLVNKIPPTHRVLIFAF